MKYFHFLFFLFSISLSAQIKGVVKDSISGKPIPYVNIWVQNENIGSTTEENGEFTINISDKNKKIIFSALGFEKKTVSIKNNLEVKLIPTDYQLEEVVIFKTLGTEEIEIGNYETSGFRFGVGNINSAVFFLPDVKMLKHPFFKQIKFLTKSDIDNAKIRIKILSANKDKFPGESLIDKEIIVSVKKGKNKNFVNIIEHNLKIPKDGFFIVFEKLLIEENKYFFEFNYKDKQGKKIKYKQMSIEPELCYVPEEKDIVWESTINGEWIKSTKHLIKNPKSYENLLMRKYHDKYLMPSMLITLSN